MNKKHYTNEENILITIALLKAHGIRKVIASPGATNVTFVGSLQHDSFSKYIHVWTNGQQLIWPVEWRLSRESQ